MFRPLFDKYGMEVDMNLGEIAGVDVNVGMPWNFHINGRAPMLDIQKSYMFNVIFIGLQKVASKSSIPFFQEDVIVRCNSVTIPQANIKPLETNFAGETQYFAGKKKTGGIFTCVFSETEDQQMTRMFYEWMQNTVNHDQESGTVGVAKQKHKHTSDVIVQMYAGNKIPLPFSYKLFNCWPVTIESTSRAFIDNTPVSVTVQFQCDNVKLVMLGTNLDYGNFELGGGLGGLGGLFNGY